MQTYRVNFLDQTAHNSSSPTVFECANDEAATKVARQLFSGNDIELWRGRHLVDLVSRR